MQQLRSDRPVLETYRLEMVARQEMGNATGTSRRASLGKLATDDASPPRSPFIQQVGECQACPIMRMCLDLIV